MSSRTKSKSVCEAAGKPTSISLKPVLTSMSNMRRLRAASIGSISAWLPSRRSTLHHWGGRVMTVSGQVRRSSGMGAKALYLSRGSLNICRFLCRQGDGLVRAPVPAGTYELKTLLCSATPWRREGSLRLATQVQARTQQLTASKGQSGPLLDRAHGPNLAQGRGGWQEWPAGRRDLLQDRGGSPRNRTARPGVETLDMSWTAGSHRPLRDRATGAATAIAVFAAGFLGCPPSTVAQQVDFQIVWVVIGEAASGDTKRSARAGKQLFMASDLVQWSLQRVQVTKVDAAPVVIELRVGEEICVSSLELRAYASDPQPLDGAPMSIAVRQDQKERLGLRRSRHDICMKPQEVGEFPVRFTSLVPAPDGTMRGAQVFVRAKEQ